jgi:hypothetical protein
VSRLQFSLRFEHRNEKGILVVFPIALHQRLDDFRVNRSDLADNAWEPDYSDTVLLDRIVTSLLQYPTGIASALSIRTYEIFVYGTKLSILKDYLFKIIKDLGGDPIEEEWW